MSKFKKFEDLRTGQALKFTKGFDFYIQEGEVMVIESKSKGYISVRSPVTHGATMLSKFDVQRATFEVQL